MTQPHTPRPLVLAVDTSFEIRLCMINRETPAEGPGDLHTLVSVLRLPDAPGVIIADSHLIVNQIVNMVGTEVEG